MTRDCELSALSLMFVQPQGVAHRATGEMANLPELASRTGRERAADEMAHTTFFPCLVLHSAHQSLYGAADSSSSSSSSDQTEHSS